MLRNDTILYLVSTVQFRCPLGGKINMAADTALLLWVTLIMSLQDQTWLLTEQMIDFEVTVVH